MTGAPAELPPAPRTPPEPADAPGRTGSGLVSVVAGVVIMAAGVATSGIFPYH